MATSYSSNNLSEVLTSLIQEYKINESELARNINLPRATINRLASGKIVDPKSSTLTLIANYFGITIDQLLGYERIDFSKKLKSSNKFRIPLIDVSQLSEIYKINKQLNLGNIIPRDIITFEHNHNNPEAMFALKVNGEAMWPYFDNNSTIIIDTTLKPQNRSFVISHISRSGEIILRQLLIDVKSRVLTPINTAFQAITLEDQDLIIGVVIHVEKSFLDSTYN